jgi:hypothetical protein
MMKKMLLTGIMSIAVVAVVFRCTQIEYNNPIDIEGKNKDFLLAHPDLLEDKNGNDTADLFEMKDTTHPVIKLIYGDTVEIQKDDSTQQLNIYLSESSINVTDAGGGPIIIRTPVEYNVNVFTVSPTPYWIKYTATDTSGNTTTATRYVLVVEQTASGIDNKPPWMSLMDDTMYITQGDSFVDPGVTAFDLHDGDLKSKVKSTGTVNINVPDTYTITYSVADSAGNPASITRVVIVLPRGQGTDNVPPVITLAPPDTLYIPAGQTIETYVFIEPGYTATDNVDGDITSKVVRSEMKFLSSEFYYFDYMVKDAADNAAVTKRRYINTGIKGEGNPPSIDLTFPDSTIQIVLGGTWIEPGYKAFDLDDKDITDKVIVNDTNVTNNISKVGNYTVIYTVTNTKGLTAQKTRRVAITKSKFDTEGPVITLKGKNPDTVLVRSSTSYKDPGYTAIDDFDGDVTDRVTVSGTVDMTRLKSYIISYTAKDNMTNSTTERRTVWVVPDTTSANLFIRYNVPSPDSLPLVKGDFKTFNTDGDGPDLTTTILTSVKFEWTPATQYSQPQFQFSFSYSAPPNYTSFNSVSQTFAKPGPKMTLKGTSIDGLDGTYYVTYQEKALIWVRSDTSFAIILTK